MFRNLRVSHLLKKTKKILPPILTSPFHIFHSPLTSEKYSFSYNVIWYEQRLFYFSIFLFSLFFSLKCEQLFMNVYVHVCERKRERKRERKKERENKRVFAIYISKIFWNRVHNYIMLSNFINIHGVQILLYGIFII